MFKYAIVNPPYIDPNKGKNSGKLYDIIWDKIAQNVSNIIYLAPVRFVKNYKVKKFTNVSNRFKFPGVGQDVCIYEKMSRKPKCDIILENYGFETDPKEKYRKNGRYDYIKKNTCYPSLRDYFDKTNFVRNPISKGNIGIVNSANKFIVYLEGEIPKQKTIWEFKVPNPQKIKEYLLSDEMQSRIKWYCKTFHYNWVTNDFDKTIQMPQWIPNS